MRGDDRADAVGRAVAARTGGRGRGSLARACRPPRLRLRFGVRASAGRARSRARRVCVRWSGGSGCGVEQCPTGRCRSSWRSVSGAVTITLRSWTSASRRTSTALRRASNSTRRASWRSPARGSVIALAARAERAALIASSGSSLPCKRRSARAVRPTSTTASPRSLRKRVSPAP